MKFILILFFVSLNAYALTGSKAAEDKGWESNVFLSIPGFDDNGDSALGFCNGTLVNSDTMITAAHCFLKSEIPSGKKMKIEIGEYRYIIKDGVKKKIGYRSMIAHETSVKVRVLPGVNLNGTSVPPELDIAVVKLDAPVNVPPDFIYAPVWTSALPALTAASKLTVVTVNPMETITHMDTKQMGSLDRFSQERINITSTSTARVGPGDSGGPLFAQINGKTYLIGVVKGTVTFFGMTKDIFVTFQGRISLN